MRMKVRVISGRVVDTGDGDGDGEDGGTRVARDVGKISSGSSPLPSIDILKGSVNAEQLQRTRTSIRERHGPTDEDMVKIYT